MGRFTICQATSNTSPLHRGHHSLFRISFRIGRRSVLPLIEYWPPLTTETPHGKRMHWWSAHQDSEPAIIP